MAGRIARSFIDDLVSRVDIVEVIDARVPLKKAGREYEACCPFHNEKTPSFKVNQQKQFYHCFGCKAGGSAITFLMEYDHLEFVEAIEELAKHIGVEVEYEEGGRSDPEQQRLQKEAKTNLYDLLGQCDRYYRQQLRQHPRASGAVDYLKNRGLSGEIAARYNIGYAPPGTNIEQAIPGQTEQLIISGMLIRKDDGKTFDRFWHRIMFPIRDSRGRVIGFGGRIIPEQNGENSPSAAKYLNSPETPIFHKGRELYGLYEVRKALRDIPRLLVVEGYMDVIALAQQDINYAVASLGTACTTEHVQKLFRLASEVVFCFDGDRAGHEAAWRALENSLPGLQGTQQIRFLFLPDGEDPDSMVRKTGKQGFEELIDKAQSLSQYFFDHLREGISRHDLEGHRTLIDKTKPYLQKMSDAAYKTLLIKDLASYTQRDERDLHGLIGSGQGPEPAFNSSPPRVSFSSSNNQQLPPSLVRTALRCLLFHPPLASELKETESLSQIDQPGMGLLLDLLDILKTNPTLTTAALLERWRGTIEGQHLAKLATWQPTLNDPESLQQEFLGAIERLQAQHLSARTDTLLAKANQGVLSPEEKTELQTLLSRT